MFVMEMRRNSSLSHPSPRVAMIPISVARREFNRSPCASQVVRENPSRFLWRETLEKPNNSAILHMERAGGKGFWAFRPKLLTFVRLLLALVCEIIPTTPRTWPDGGPSAAACDTESASAPRGDP